MGRERGNCNRACSLVSVLQLSAPSLQLSLPSCFAPISPQHGHRLKTLPLPLPPTHCFGTLQQRRLRSWSRSAGSASVEINVFLSGLVGCCSCSGSTERRFLIWCLCCLGSPLEAQKKRQPGCNGRGRN